MSQVAMKSTPSLRNHGVDLLRNVSMFFVVILHVLGNGGLLSAAASDTVKYEQLKAMHIAAMCAVNCYGIISGYVGWRSKFKLSGIITLWLQVFLYSAGIGLAFCLLKPEAVSFENIKQLCLPVLSKQYWYFTAYFALFFTMPLLNSAIQNIPRRLFEVSFGILVCLLTFGQQTLLVSNVFATSSGYSYLWLMVLYCIGGYLGKYHSEQKAPARWFVVYVGCVAICWTAQYTMRRLGIEDPTRLEAYNSPVMLLMGIALVQMFASIKLPNWLAKLSGFLVPASFGVYLIYVHPLLWTNIWRNAFRKFAAYPAWTMVPLLIGLSVAVYLVCSAIDLIRHYLFKAIRLKALLSKLDEKILPDGGNT